jgi:hypothetical protein
MNKTNERSSTEMDRTNISAAERDRIGTAERDRMGRCAGVTPRLPINPSPRPNLPRHLPSVSKLKFGSAKTQEGKTQNRDGTGISEKKIFPYNLYYVN